MALELRTVGRAALLVALVAVVYWPTLDNGLVSDDRIYVTINQELSTLSGLRDIWCKLGTTTQYYPVTHSVLWGEFHLWGLNARGYHAINLAMHTVVAIGLWRLLLRLAVPGAFLAAAIFAVHPVEVESVAWASELKNLLSAMLAIGSIMAYLRFAPPAGCNTTTLCSPSRAHACYALSLTLYLLAVLSKTAVITLPGVLLVIDWWKNGRITPRDITRLSPFFVIAIVLAAMTVWMEQTTVGATGPEWQISFPARLIIAGRALWFYAAKLAWPHPLAFIYPRWQVDAQTAWMYLYPMAGLALVAALWLARHRIGRGPLAAVLIFAGVLSPVLGFVNIYWFLYSFVADHFQYHASMALIALGAATCKRVADRWLANPFWLAPLLAAGMLLPLAILSHNKTGAWRSDATLVADSVASCPASWAGRFHLANDLAQANHHEQAIEQYREALRLFPERAEIHTPLGSSLLALGRTEPAADEYRLALAGTLDDDERRAAHYLLGMLLFHQQKLGEAIENFGAAIAVDPHAVEAIYQCGLAQREQGDLPAALDTMQRLLQVEPQSVRARRALGLIYSDLGRLDEAAAALQEAQQIEPQNARLCEELGTVRLKQGDAAAAEQELRRAVRFDPRSAGARNLLGVALAQRGNLEAAIEQFQAALAIDPRHQGAIDNLSRAQAAKQPPVEK